MENTSKIFVAGHRGLMGSALVRRLRARGYTNLLLRTHEELDLADHSAVARFFAQEQPEYVFLAAAKVGGILANSTYTADFIGQNIFIQTNVMHEAYRCGVNRLLFLGSSCIYPKHAPQPIKEEYLLSGPLEMTNRPYAIAKISGIEMCRSYNQQFGTRFLAAMPTNLFGPDDHYDLQNSHAVPALIRKMHEGKVRNATQVEVWGTGHPRREFLYSEDAADACLFLMNLSDQHLSSILTDEEIRPLVNIGRGQDLTVCELAELIAETVGFKGRLVFDPSKPDGAPRKLLDTSRLTALGWKNTTTLREGLIKTYRDFVERQALSEGVRSVSTSAT